MPIKRPYKEMVPPVQTGFTPLETTKTRSVSSWSQANSLAGFTLVEIIVATGIFAAVMLVAVGSLMSIIDANRKAQSQQIVMSNLSAAVEGMSRTIRSGASYACDASLTSSANAMPTNCDGGVQLSFKPKEAISGSGSASLRWVYRRNTEIVNGTTQGYVEVSKDNGATYSRITAPEIDVQGLKFYVAGSCPKNGGGGCGNDSLQPRALLTVFGSAQLSSKTRTIFNIQTMITQRLFDI